MADRLHSALEKQRLITACKSNPPSQLVFHPAVDDTVRSEKNAAFPPPPILVDSLKKDESAIIISIEKRRPFKELKKDQSRGTYERQVSYFSEASARLQREKSARLQKYYQTELGRAYRYCFGTQVETVHQAPDSGSVTCVDYSSDGHHLAQGLGNGLVKVLKNDTNLTTIIDTRRSSSRDKITRVKLFGFRHLYLAFCNRNGRVYLSRYFSESTDHGRFEPSRSSEEIDEDHFEEADVERGASKHDEYAFSARSIRMKNKTVSDDSGEVRERKQKKERGEVHELKIIREKQKKLFDSSSGVTCWKCHLFVQEHNEIEALDVNVCSTHMITGGKDATIRLYDINMGKVVKEYQSHKRDCFLTYSSSNDLEPNENEGHFLRIHALRFSDVSRNIFASGGLDGVVKIWDSRAPHAVRNLVGPMICGDSLDIMGFKLISGQWTSKSSLELFDLRTFGSVPVVPTNRIIGTLSEYPYCCKFLRGWGICQGAEFVDGDLIVSGYANSLEILSISDKKIIKAFPSEGNVVSVSNYMQTIAAASTDNALTFYSFIPNEYAAVHVFNIKDFEPDVEEGEDEELVTAAVLEKTEDFPKLWTAKFGNLWAVKKDDEFVKYVGKVKRVMKGISCEGVTHDGESTRRVLLKKDGDEEDRVFGVLSDEIASSERVEEGGAVKTTLAERILSDIDPKRLADDADRKFLKRMKAKMAAERSRQADAKIVKEIDGAFKDETTDYTEEILEFAEKPGVLEEPLKLQLGRRKKKQVSIMESRN